MVKRQYSDEEKASALAALDANRGNVKATAQVLRIPASTLTRWRDGEGVVPAVADMREIKKADLADRLEDLAHLITDTMPNKLADADLQKLATSLGITIDKMRLLREQATSISQNLTDEQRVERVADLLERARARRDGRAPLQAIK